MLRRLVLSNLILIDHSEIEFEPGFNSITGETGSGKSAIMQGLKLLCGEKFDTNLIRYGCEKGALEAAFDLPENSNLYDLLESAGIDCDPEDLLILRREFQINGKNRCFINNQLVQRQFIQKVASYLVHIVSQHASRELLLPDAHRDIVDTFGDLQGLAFSFARQWSKEKALRARKQELLASEQERQRKIHALTQEVEELTEADLKEGEDEELYAEYTLLTNADTLTSYCDEVLNLFQSDPKGILSSLNRAERTMTKLCGMDAAHMENAQAIKNALFELQEVANTLERYRGKIENNPQRTAFIDARMNTISKLKKRYGPDVAALLNYLKQAEEQLFELNNYDATLEAIDEELELTSAETSRLAKELSEKRLESAKKLSAALTDELRTLNMPNVNVSISVENQPRNSQGDDYVEIYLQPNLGEKMVPLKQCASGGEISRVLLALHHILSGKGQVASIVFDEIDANIGGFTASIVGQKLNSIGKKQQVLCITHFPQVASQAHHHLLISKGEKEGRTCTTVVSLDKAGKEKELTRMSGAVPAAV